MQRAPGSLPLRCAASLAGSALALAWSALALACGDTAPGPVGAGVAAGRVLNARPLGPLTRWAHEPSEGGEPWLAYYAADGRLYVRRPDGTESDLTPSERLSAPSGLAVEAADGRLGVLWRDKLPEKRLYYTVVSSDGEAPQTRLLDGERDPLTRMQLATRGGETFFLWYGESRSREGRDYQYYLRTLGPDGALTPTRQVMPGIYPTWIVDRRHVPIFSYTVARGRPVIAMRRFDRSTRALGPFETVAEVPPSGPFLRAVRAGECWLVFWVGHYGRDYKELLLEGVRSDDAGATWTRFSFPSLRGLDFSRIDAAADAQGNVLLAVGGAFRFHDRDARSDVYLLHSHDAGGTWSPPVRLRPERARATHADLPSVAFGSDGTAVVVWQDWRDIRSNVYASASADGGRSWSPALPLAAPGAANLGFDPGASAIRWRAGRFHVAAARSRGDELALRDVVLFSFSAEQLRDPRSAVASEAPAPRDDERLRGRIAAYWEAKREGDPASAYPLLDPFFRSQRSAEDYARQTGRIRYHAYRIREIRFPAERVARVRLSVEASLPELEVVPGATVSRPAERYDVTEDWVFVDGDWFREYHEEATDRRFTRQ